LEGTVMQNWSGNNNDHRCSNRFRQSLPYHVLHQIPTPGTEARSRDFTTETHVLQPKSKDSSSPVATAQQSTTTYRILHRDNHSTTLGW
jgi:hypothetical protein